MNFKNPEFIRLIKAISFGVLASIIFFTIINFSYSWFLKNREENLGVTIGKIDITTVNANYALNPLGQQIVNAPVKIRNDQNVKTLLRAKIIFYWEDNTSIENVNFILEDEFKWHYNQSDDRYYYKEILYPNGKLGFYTDFLKSVDLTACNGSRLNENFRVDIYAEAIQYVGDAHLDVWAEAPVALLNW